MNIKTESTEKKKNSCLINDDQIKAIQGGGSFRADSWVSRELSSAENDSFTPPATDASLGMAQISLYRCQPGKKVGRNTYHLGNQISMGYVLQRVQMHCKLPT